MKMSKPITKRLTPAQRAALNCVNASTEVDFSDLMKVGATGNTMKTLVSNGLARRSYTSPYVWYPTDAGRAAVDAGKYEVR